MSDNVTVNNSVTTVEAKKEVFEKSNLYNWSKKLIMILVSLIALIGVFGASHILFFATFSMADFVLFLQHFMPYFGFLSGGISIGGIAKNVLKHLNLTKQLEAASTGTTVDPSTTQSVGN